MVQQRLLFIIFFLSLFFPLSNVFAGTILNSYKYAWSDNAGYINFENVSVEDNALSGYAWSANYGWIKFDPAKGGVFNDGAGNLSGSAWGENLGWINFDDVSITSSTGKFSGSATGALIGTINFDCPNFCDVRTDWRQAVTPAVTPSSGSVVLSFISSIFIPPQINTYNVPLVLLPEQSGIFVQETSSGKVTLDIPQKSVTSKTIFTIAEEPLTQNNNYLLVKSTELINAVFYDVSAKDSHGNYIHTFSNPITITLPIPARFSTTKNLGVYWLNETNWQWVLIPDAVFSNNTVTFKVNHLTKFAIFATTDPVLFTPKKPSPEISLPLEKKPVQKIGTPITQQKIEELIIKKQKEIEHKEATTTVTEKISIQQREKTGKNVLVISIFIILLVIIWTILKRFYSFNRTKKRW